MMPRLTNLMKSAGRQFLATGTILCLLTLGSVSIGHAQTANLTGTFNEKGYCDDGGGAAEKVSSTFGASIFINFNSFPNVSMTVSGAFATINLAGFAFAKNSKSGVFGLFGLSTDSVVVLNGVYKINGINLTSIKGSFTTTFDDGADQCVYVGKFKAS